MRGRGLPRWWALQLEMFSTCTCYSRLHWRWLGYVSPSYCTMWPSLVLARIRFLLDHVLGPYFSTCQFSIGTRVMLRLDHVSLLHWTMCVFLLVHVAISYSTTCHGAVHPRFIFLFGHVASWLPSTCQILIAHVLSPGYCACHALVRWCVTFLFDQVACLGSTAWSTINLL
jgi:hypothetical protein